jgi:hypothetical protein
MRSRIDSSSKAHSRNADFIALHYIDFIALHYVDFIALHYVE